MEKEYKNIRTGKTATQVKTAEGNYIFVPNMELENGDILEEVAH